MFNNNETSSTTIKVNLKTFEFLPLTDDKKVDVSVAKIPRPSNAFILYSNEHRQSIARENPKDSNKEISRKLGKKWRTLSVENKNKYYLQAKQIAYEHKKKYPTYCYNPKLARVKKTMRNEQRKLNNVFQMGLTNSTETVTQNYHAVNATSTLNNFHCLNSPGIEHVTEKPKEQCLIANNSIKKGNDLNDIKEGHILDDGHKILDVQPAVTKAPTSTTLDTNLPVNKEIGLQLNQNQINGFIQLGATVDFLVDGTMWYPYLTIPKNMNTN